LPWTDEVQLLDTIEDEDANDRTLGARLNVHRRCAPRELATFATAIDPSRPSPEPRLGLVPPRRDIANQPHPRAHMHRAIRGFPVTSGRRPAAGADGKPAPIRRGSCPKMVGCSQGPRLALALSYAGPR